MDMFRSSQFMHIVLYLAYLKMLWKKYKPYRPWLQPHACYHLNIRWPISNEPVCPARWSTAHNGFIPSISHFTPPAAVFCFPFPHNILLPQYFAILSFCFAFHFYSKNFACFTQLSNRTFSSMDITLPWWFYGWWCKMQKSTSTENRKTWCNACFRLYLPCL